MNTEKILEIVSCIDPALIEEAGGMENRKRRALVLTRVGAVAACLCLALTGTAFTANLIVGNFRTMEFYELQWLDPPPDRDGIAEVVNGYIFYGGAVEFFPVDSFSAEARDCAKEVGATTTNISFPSLADAIDYYQIKVPENSFVSEITPQRCDTQMDSSDVGITRVTLQEVFYDVSGANDLNMYITTIVLSELIYSPKREVWFDYGYSTDFIYTTEEYSSNGITAFISYATSPRVSAHPYYRLFGCECYRAHLIVDGCVIEIVVSCSGHSEQGRTLLEEVLNGYS